MTQADNNAQVPPAIDGQCLCGSVKISLHMATPDIDICHCTMCRQWSGGPFAGVKGKGFDVSGEACVTAFRSSAWAERAFCSTCGSNLWYRFIPGDHHSFSAGLFDLDKPFAMGPQIFIDEKPEWYDFAQATDKKTGAEIMAEAKAAGFSFD